MEIKKAFSEYWTQIQDEQGVSQWQERVLEPLTDGSTPTRSQFRLNMFFRNCASKFPTVCLVAWVEQRKMGKRDIDRFAKGMGQDFNLCNNFISFSL